MQHKRSVWLAAPAATVLLAACGGGSGGDDAATLSFANSYPTDHPHTECGTQAVADKINEQDLGIEIEVFSDSQLGGDVDRVASVMSGDIDMDVQGSAALGSSYEPIGVMDAAYAFDDVDHLFEFFDSKASDQLKKDFETETEARILDVWYFGDRHFTANEPIETPEDLDGLRMRFPDSQIYLENAKALGAEATAVAFEEVYTALQQGIVDGQENPVPTIESMSFAEVQSHVSMTHHQIGSQMVVVSQQTWEQLNEEQRKALQKAVSDTRAENRECMEQAEAEILDKWEQDGSVEVVEADLDAFRQQVHDYFESNLDGRQLELWNEIRAAS